MAAKKKLPVAPPEPFPNRGGKKKQKPAPARGGGGKGGVR